jgi:hypothetical protein
MWAGGGIRHRSGGGVRIRLMRASESSSLSRESWRHIHSFIRVASDPHLTMIAHSPRFERSIDQFESSDCSMDTGIFSYIIPATWQFHPCGQSPMNSQKPVQTQIRAPLPELRNYRFVLRGIASTDGCRTSGRRFRVR